MKMKNVNKGVKPVTPQNPFPKYRCYGDNKDNLHFENNKNQGDDVESDVKVNPGATDGGLSTFVGGKFSRLRI